jgi:hypothetical protein
MKRVMGGSAWYQLCTPPPASATFIGGMLLLLLLLLPHTHRRMRHAPSVGRWRALWSEEGGAAA